MKDISISFLVLFILQIEVMHLHAMNINFIFTHVYIIEIFRDLFLQESFFNNFLQQSCTSQNRYCQEAVKSVEIVISCPSSKAEWDDAARRKDCGRLASKQNCTTAENFLYHCVINGLGNKLLEVCGPKRIIFGT